MAIDPIAARFHKGFYAVRSSVLMMYVTAVLAVGKMILHQRGIYMDKNGAGLVVKRLEELYPAAACALEYEGEAWKLLVMARLSAQCTDKRVNIVSSELFEKYTTAESLAMAELADVENIVRPCGLYRVKAKDIIAECQRLCGECHGVMPDDIDKLLEFQGVGRKIANLIVGDIYKKPAVVADTHCIRISARLGLTPKGTKDPLKTEKTLKKLIEPEKQNDFCHRLVMFGREYCKAQGFDCGSCPLADLCEKQITI